MDTLFCANCTRGVLDGVMTAAAHNCATCPNTTYTAFKVCVCCAVENSTCMNCGTAFDAGIDDAARALIASHRVMFNTNLTAAQTSYDVALADIRPDIDSWLRVNTECAAKYEAARAAQPDNWRAFRDEHFAPIEAERTRIGEAKLQRHEHAVQARHIKIERASRRFELEATRILGHRAVDQRYLAALAGLMA